MSDNEDNFKNKLNLLVKNLQKSGFSFDEILSMMSPNFSTDKILIPLEIFKNRDLGALESISLFLKDEKNMRYSEIAKALDRDQRTIWTTYNKAKNKVK